MATTELLGGSTGDVCEPMFTKTVRAVFGSCSGAAREAELAANSTHSRHGPATRILAGM